MLSSRSNGTFIASNLDMQTAQSSPEPIERRRVTRTALQEGCLIFESVGAVGEVLDISTAGMGLQTIYSLPEAGRLPGEGLLFCHGILLEHLSYWIASSAVLPTDYEFSTVVKRRYGILFRNLTESQKIKINKIIKICHSA